VRQHPRLLEAAQTTSNVKDRDAVTAWVQRRFHEQSRAVHKLRSAFDGQMRELLTADGVATAAEVVGKYRNEWNQSLAQMIGRPDEMAKAKRTLRSAADESLRRELPAYNAIKALQQEYSRAVRALVGKHANLASGLSVHPADWANDLDNFGMEEFVPPFDVSDLTPVGPLIETNLSSTVPSLGYVMNDITWRMDDTFDLGVPLYDPVTANEVALGINFEAPQSGFLNVAVELRNLYNHMQVSATDNFGLSSAEVYISHAIIALVLRDGDRISGYTSVVYDGYIDPSGDDFHRVFPDIPQGPVVCVVSVEDALRAGEQVQILGGCETYIVGHVHDMDCRASAKVLWQVQKLYVWLT